jgi:hypothetical protein
VKITRHDGIEKLTRAEGESSQKITPR